MYTACTISYRNTQYKPSLYYTSSLAIYVVIELTVIANGDLDLMVTATESSTK